MNKRYRDISRIRQKLRQNRNHPNITDYIVLLVFVFLFIYYYVFNGNLDQNVMDRISFDGVFDQNVKVMFSVGLGVIVVTVLIFIATWVIKRFKKQIKKTQYLSSDIRRVNGMTGEEFEEYVGAHFEAQGYKVEITASSYDYGADLVMRKDGILTVVQAKRYRGKVGNKAIQEVVGSMGYYKADKGIVITNSYFTSNAKNLAKANDIELWDRDRLISEFL